MSIDQASPLVPITPQVTLQNSAFIKNSHNRSSFCGVVPSPTNGNGNTFKTFSVNRKSWSGNATFTLQQRNSSCDVEPSAPTLASFRSGTGTFPRNRERNNNAEVTNGILTPNGNTVHTFRGNEVRRSNGCSNGRRYAEIGNWSKRSSTFLEPHLQGIGVRVPTPDSDIQDDRSTEDDEKALIPQSSPHTEPPPLKPREFFERLQSQALREQERPERKPSNQRQEHHFRPLDTDGSLGDSLSQSRESLSSDGEGAKGDCSSVDSSASEPSEEHPVCDIGILERLIRTHPVWFLPGIQRAGAFHLLQGKEEGNFVVRQSSQPETMAISVRLPQDKGPYIEHYLIQSCAGRIGLETSHNRFDNIPELIAHYCECCDELPVQLTLPRPLREAKSRQQLTSIALLGQEFWGYPMSNAKNIQQNLMSPCQLSNGVVPMALTPSDTGSSLSSFGNVSQNKEQVATQDKDDVVLKMSPMGAESPPRNNQNMSTFKGRTAPSPPVKPSGSFNRAARPTPPNTLNLMTSTAHITQDSGLNIRSSPIQSVPSNPKSTPPPPPPRWAKPQTKSTTSPMTESNAFAPSIPTHSNGITVTTTVTVSVNDAQIDHHQTNEQHRNDMHLPLNNNVNNNTYIGLNGKHFETDDKDGNIAHRLSPEGDSIRYVHDSYKRQVLEQSSRIESPTEPQSHASEDPAVNSMSKSYSTSFAPNQIVSPNGSNSVTSGIFSPTSQINSPLSETVSSKSGVFSPISQTTKSELFSPVSRSSPLSTKMSSPYSNSNSFENQVISPVSGKDRDKVLSPGTHTVSTTNSGRSRRSKHSMRKQSKHYQESDILESPGVYYRSSLMDKVSDYEDIWGPENNNCSTFKSTRTEDNSSNNGLMKSKRPDLLPDTLPKLNSAKSTTSILEKENLNLINSVINDKLDNPNNSLKKKMKGSCEMIATTNSKGEIVPKRPDKLSIMKNVNKQLTEEIEAKLKEREIKELTDIESNSVVSNNDMTQELIPEERNSNKAGSPFYADPVDALQENIFPMVQRRKFLRTGNLVNRHSEPPQNNPYFPLRDMQSIEELSPASPNTSTSVDNLVSLKNGKPKMKPVQPPRICGKPPIKPDPTWTVDSSWEFIGKQEDQASSESGTFPSLVEQESKLSGVGDGHQNLTVHQIVAQRLPELNLNPDPISLPEEIRSPPRTSCYDNVLDHRPISEQASDDGTVFSEPWDSAQWDGILPPSNGHQPYDGDEPSEWESPISRRGPAGAARAKSFRDRLDPLLAAGRIRALRGSKVSRGGAGAALRAYALHLAQDKSTTFAQNIDNFIACTLDSKEVCPQVVMRNMRQFMSGMKNYLVKHGEREFEKEVEKERLKLKSTEFLNLDAILEGVMHRLVVRPLRSRLYALLAAWHASDIRTLHAAIEKAHATTPLQLGIKASTTIPSPAVLAVISKHFLKMQEADSPLDKLENLLAAISSIFNSIRGERALGADDFLPVLAWVVARCRLVCAELEAELMAGLLPPALLAGEGGYYLTALFSAVAVLKRLAPEQSNDAATLWRRGSLECAGGGGGDCAVVRVALPDECRGSIRRVALPCRPGARARDLCRALAHAAAITNPQDYALFALYNGQETMLQENDCPQEMMAEKNGQNCVLAYKRIDAKIAWPQQALLSLP